MTAKSAIRVIGTLLLMAACAPLPPPPPTPLNSPVFARRAPLPGQRDYLETIRYIDNGLHYVSPAGGFFVSGAGEMCFTGILSPTASPYANYRDYWCISPGAVGTVDALTNGMTYVDAVRLWCRHEAPQCAHKLGYPNILDKDWEADSITAEIIPYREERTAIEHLVFLMGGEVAGANPALPQQADGALDTPPRAASVAVLTRGTEDIR